MENYKKLQNEGKIEICQYIISYFKDNEGMLISELCDQIVEDYFIVGYYQSEQWLINNIGIFEAINIIQNYENYNFGKVLTDFSSSEKVVNMLIYIIGEELLYGCYTISTHCDDILTDELLAQIIEYFENL